ncbi:MAG: hypothetical protein KGI29_10720 [Pseudomonadota bacterium]|nr:hypothetical protein [Pseudomonadota bacterium]MDE3037139.1 hypothetical protein [Pseudomonadota bacterium]
MTNGNGHNGGNGNGQTRVWGNIGKELSGFGIAEAASECTWLGLVAVEDTLIPKNLMKSVSRVVGKVIVEPYFLNIIEKNYEKICKLDECKPDMTKSRQERAEILAEALIKYVPAIAAAWEVKLLVRRHMNEKMGVPHDAVRRGPAVNAPIWKKAAAWVPYGSWSPQERMIFLADEGLHMGSLYVLNNQLAPQTDDMIRSTGGMIQNMFGFSHRKAHELATAAWVWAVPNGIGALGGALAITAKHRNNWPKGVIGRFLGRKNSEHPTPPSL